MGNHVDGTNGRYQDLSHDQLVRLLEKHDRQKKLGLVWERNELEADRVLESQFVALELLPEKSDPAINTKGWSNLVIEGDNYDALRWMRMTLAGRVKCIYVDPPYNTGAKDWVYNDHYVAKEDRWRHSTWLEFLYRRFALARDLLTDDGVILVSINDENRAKLELLLDEVLPGMRKGSLVWRTRVGGNEGGEAFLSDNHEHILVYGNAGFRFGGTEKTFELYRNTNNHPRGPWKAGGDLTVSVNYKDRRAGKAYYPLHDSGRDIWYPCNPDAVWRYASRAVSGPNARIKTRFMEDWIAAGQILFPDEGRVVQYDTREALIEGIRRGEVPGSGRSLFLREDLPNLDFWIGKRIGFGTPSFIRFQADLKSTTQPLSSWITPKSEIDTKLEGDSSIVSGTTDEGSRAVKNLFGGKAFTYPKPPSLIRGLLEQATAPGDLVLDFFAGSATTAQAVMQLNIEDEGDRRFIMVSSTEATVEEPHKNLCDVVTAQRVRLLNASTEPAYLALHAPFAYLRVVTLQFEDLDYDLTPAQAWGALETMHALPLTVHDSAAAWTEHETAEVVMILVERIDDALIQRLQNLNSRLAPAFVYAWAPAQVTAATGPLNLEVRPVRDALVSRFRG